jgi:hypothetical protein
MTLYLVARKVLIVKQCVRAAIAQSVWRIVYGLENLGFGVRFPVWERDFSLFHNVKTGSGTHTVSYAMDMEGYLYGNKAAGAWN